jgi:hypothetical protein
MYKDSDMPAVFRPFDVGENNCDVPVNEFVLENLIEEENDPESGSTVSSNRSVLNERDRLHFRVDENLPVYANVDRLFENDLDPENDRELENAVLCLCTLLGRISSDRDNLGLRVNVIVLENPLFVEENPRRVHEKPRVERRPSESGKLSVSG